MEKWVFNPKKSAPLGGSVAPRKKKPYRVIRNVEVAKTDLSDHDLVKVNLLYNMKAPVKPHVSSFESQSFRSIDLRKADFEVINQTLADIDWDTLFDLCSQDSSGNDFVELVRLTVLQACLLNCPENFLVETLVVPNNKIPEIASFSTVSVGNLWLSCQPSKAGIPLPLESEVLKMKST